MTKFSNFQIQSDHFKTDEIEAKRQSKDKQISKILLKKSTDKINGDNINKDFFRNDTDLETDINPKGKNYSYDFFIFSFLGVTCFISMNAFISSIDCIIYFQKEFNPDSIFNNIFFFANVSIQIFLTCTRVKYSTWKMLKVSLLGSAITLLIFPILIIFFSNIYSYSLCCILILINGFFSGIYLYLMNGILSFLVFKNLVFVITGQAISSVIISILKIGTFFLINSDEKFNKTSSLILVFAVAFLIIILTFIIIFLLKERKDFSNCFYNLDQTNKIIYINNNLDKFFDNNNAENPNNFTALKNAVSQNKVFFINVIFFSFSTYLFHPNNFISMKLFSTNIDLSIIFTIGLFNIFDSLGRLSTNYFFLKKKSSVYILNFSRLYFCIIFVLISITILNKNQLFNFGIFRNQIFISINIALFAYSFGFLNSNSFILLGSIQDKAVQLKSNLTNSICIGVGVFIGSSFSNFFNNLFSREIQLNF